jgi:hypothetical protein
MGSKMSGMPILGIHSKKCSNKVTRLFDNIDKAKGNGWASLPQAYTMKCRYVAMNKPGVQIKYYHGCQQLTGFIRISLQLLSGNLH